MNQANEETDRVDGRARAKHCGHGICALAGRALLAPKIGWRFGASPSRTVPPVPINSTEQVEVQ